MTVPMSGGKLVSLVCAAILAFPAHAEDLPQPEGDVVLTVTGAVGVTNHGDAAVFDLGLLKSLGEVSFRTTTPWTDGEHIFTGVPLSALLQRLAVTEGTLTATAINDYAVEIPVSDAVPGGPIIAYLQNGDPMSVREKGPLWVVYPYDLDEDYRAEVIYARSIWQLTTLTVRAD